MTGASLSSCGWTLAEVRTNAPTRQVKDELYIYTWSSYVDQTLLDNFRAQTGIRVIADIYDSNETMLATFQAGKGAIYSIIYPSDYKVTNMKDLGLLTPLDHNRLNGLDNLLPQFRQNIHDPGNQYSIPVSWGTTGLIYNTEKVSPPPTDWNYLWEHRDQLSRRITLLNDVREVLGAVLRSLGYSYNSTNPQEIETAFKKLAQLKPAIATFTSDAWRDQLLAGDLLIAMGYSVDGISVMKENPKLQYIIPTSGTSLWSDTVVIPKTAPNPEGAYAWLNYMLDPAVASQLTKRLSFATTNQAAYDQLPAPIRDNQSLFPPNALLTKSESIAPLDPQTTELLDRYWTRLTST